MNYPTSDGQLPKDRGLERAAARLHQLTDPKTLWSDLDDARKYYYRALVRQPIRDLGVEAS